LVKFPFACRFVLSKLYCTVPFDVVALTLMDPFVRLHPFGSIFVPVVIVTVLGVVEIVSVAAIALHPL